ncbi:MAG: IPT/TIG domain-containing protein [Myxococcota bacterium]
MKRASLALALTLAASLVACEEGGDIDIHAIDPQVGATQGEQPVKILGDNFRTDIGYTVYFGKKKANQVTIQDEGTLLVRSPAVDDPGSVDLIIVADNGPAWKIASGFEYEDMGGNVMEQVGETEGKAKGKLAY